VDRDATSVEAEEHRLSLNPLDGEAAKVRGSTVNAVVTHRRGAIDGEDDLFEFGDLGSSSVRLSLSYVWGTEDGGSDAEPHDAEQVLEPGSSGTLLGSAHQQGGEHATFPDQQASCAHWPAEELAGDRHRIGIKGTKVDLKVSECH
jgi:hypothetical protein